jgi:hypothetical protein
MTSSGRNRPLIDLRSDDLLKLCALLHERVPHGELLRRLGIAEEELQRRLALLRDEGLAKTSGDRMLPTAVVVTFDDAGKYFHPDDRLVESAADLIVKKLPEVKAYCRELKSLADVPFESMSFFILSDVLLDNWQISNVERLFVRADRTLRAGGRYYLNILEKSATSAAEPFGLYGNTGSPWGPVQVGLYGNDRFSGHTLLSIPDAALNQMFDLGSSMGLKEAQALLVEQVVQATRSGSNPFTASQRQALSQVGLMHDDKVSVLLLQEDDYRALDQVAAVVTSDLMSLLESNRGRILSLFRTSPYGEETSFNEYLVLWYHFFFAEVTNRLRDKGVLRLPANGTMTYFVVP